MGVWQSRTQSPQDLWPAVDHEERQIVLNFPVSPGNQPLAKEPGDSGYEIGSMVEMLKKL